METIIFEADIFVCEIPLDVEADCRVVYLDDSFDHAFGTERCGHWELDDIGELRPAECVRDAIIEEFHARGITRHNRRFKKRVRQKVRSILKKLAQLNPDQVFSESAKENAIQEGGFDPEPEYEPKLHRAYYSALAA